MNDSNNAKTMYETTCLVDAPADYFHPRFHVTGHGFAGESRCIQSGRAFDDFTIQRHPFTRLYYNRIPDVYFFRIDLFKFSIPFYICIVRANVHQACNGFSGFGNRIGLEPFSYLIEQHIQAVSQPSQEDPFVRIHRHKSWPQYG